MKHREGERKKGRVGKGGTRPNPESGQIRIWHLISLKTQWDIFESCRVEKGPGLRAAHPVCSSQGEGTGTRGSFLPVPSKPRRQRWPWRQLCVQAAGGRLLSSATGIWAILSSPRVWVGCHVRWAIRATGKRMGPGSGVQRFGRASKSARSPGRSTAACPAAPWTAVSRSGADAALQFPVRHRGGEMVGKTTLRSRHLTLLSCKCRGIFCFFTFLFPPEDLAISFLKSLGLAVVQSSQQVGA